MNPRTPGPSNFSPSMMNAPIPSCARGCPVCFKVCRNAPYDAAGTIIYMGLQSAPGGTK